MNNLNLILYLFIKYKMKDVRDPSYYGMKASNYDILIIKRGRNGKKFIVANGNGGKIWKPYVKKSSDHTACCVIL